MYVYFTSVLYPPNFSIDSISSWLPPKSFHTFLTALFHLIPPRPFFQPCQIWLATFFLACSLLYIAISTFVTSLVCSKWVHSRLRSLYYSSYLSILVLFQLLPSVLFPAVLRTSRSLPMRLLRILAWVQSHSV